MPLRCPASPSVGLASPGSETYGCSWPLLAGSPEGQKKGMSSALSRLHEDLKSIPPSIHHPHLTSGRGQSQTRKVSVPQTLDPIMKMQLHLSLSFCSLMHHNSKLPLP